MSIRSDMWSMRLAVTVAALLLCFSILPLHPAAASQSGGAPIPGDWDHEPVIISNKDRDPSSGRYKPARVDHNHPSVHAAPPTPNGHANAASDSQQQQAAGKLIGGLEHEGKFMPDHSFAAPFSSRIIPHWDWGAGATLDPSFVRLTPARQSRTGYLWNSQPVLLEEWEVILEFLVKGKKEYGGDGFAFWFVERPEVLGSVYGSTDYWTGLAVIFDTFNNDGKGPSPLISAIFNDGTQRFDAASDGASQALDSCSIDFRNPERDTPTMARIRYKDRKLSVEIALRRDREGEKIKPNWQNCLSVDGMELGVDKYFGVTAHTGDAADSHDVMRFQTFDLHSHAASGEEHDSGDHDAHLAAMRVRYSKELEKKREQSAMTTDEFQHEVLNLLQQIQAEVNMLETGQIEVSEWINLQKAAKYEQEAEDIQAGHDGRKASGTAVAGGSGSGSVGLDAESKQKLRAMVETQAALRDEVSKVTAAIQALQARQIGPAPVPGASTAAPPSASAASASSGSLSSLSSQALDQLRETFTTLLASSSLTSRLESVTSELRSMHSRQQESFKTLTDRMDQFRSQLNRLEQRTSSLAASSSSVNSNVGSAGGEVGWIIYLCVVFSALAIAVLSMHTFNQHRQRDRYKLI